MDRLLTYKNNLTVDVRKVVIAMAKDDVKKFYKELGENKELQDKIIKAQESYSGDIADRQAMVESIVVPIAKEAGYEFSAEEAYIYERKQAVEEGISEEELENVSGGWSGCLGIGASSDFAICAEIGVDNFDSTHADGGGLFVCFYVGIGLGGTKNA